MIKCEDDHRPIIYDETERDDVGRFLGCPLCDAISRIKNLNKWIDDTSQRNRRLYFERIKNS